MASDDVYHVVATITPKKEKWARAVEVLNELADNVKAHEAGALGYQLFQDRNQGEELIMVEHFKDKAAFEAHHDTDFFKKAGKIMGEEELLAKPVETKVLGALAGFASR